MHAKVVTFQIKPGRRDEATRLFQEFVIPGARKHKGFKGGMLLTDPNTGKCTSIGLWETEADIIASEASGFYKEWGVKLRKFLPGACTGNIGGSNLYLAFE